MSDDDQCSGGGVLIGTKMLQRHQCGYLCDLWKAFPCMPSYGDHTWASITLCEQLRAKNRPRSHFFALFTAWKLSTCCLLNQWLINKIQIQMKDSAAVCSSMFSKKGEEINGEKLHKLGILSLEMQLGMSTSFWIKKSYALMYSTCSALWKEESVSCCCPVLQDYYFYFMPHIFRWPKAMSVTLKQ